MPELKNLGGQSGTEERVVLRLELPDRLTTPGQIGAGQNLHKKLLRDSFHYFLSKAIPGIMGVFSVLAFVRLVGKAEYGRPVGMVAAGHLKVFQHVPW